MIASMQDHQLRVPQLLDHAARYHGDREIVTAWPDGSVTRITWATLANDARKMAQAFERLGIKPGDRVATLAMNHTPHLVAWFGAIGMGAIVHTLNPRLFDEQLIYTVNHAADRVLLYDCAFQQQVDRLRDRWPTIERFIRIDGDGPGSLLELLNVEDGECDWYGGDEREPSMLCYTSGTTGAPKGVLYTHRSTVLHAMAGVAPSMFDLSATSVVLPIVPLFHAAGWGLPFAAAIAGAKMVLCPTNEPTILSQTMTREHVTHSAGVPTVWLSLLAHADAANAFPRALRHVSIGGSAAPASMIARFEAAGVRVAHIWGMTETSPLGTMGQRPVGWALMDEAQKLSVASRQGKPPYGVELALVDDAGEPVTHDGVSPGRLRVRGPWVVHRYYAADADAVDDDGWFDTGDVAVMHPDGTMQITDRAKDMIKSGGEWISSVELENAAIGCAGVAEAAAIGAIHPKWGERPILLVVRRPGSTVTSDELRLHLQNHVAKWWLPDEVIFVEELPHTATGKLLKSALRDRYAKILIDG
ncbi:long-chain fatty acid--CoA ligase [Sphingomonas sp. CD22]|uniref:long-chain fatty acid--CoA ligase n=1 Tax=Sphingomonas sp. CD22 TaxID=3100214 RepID=UPI002AE05E9C|nr:long-chain fatty acid--CoA ligase [Sphingomonas sp. CD22]MEA1085171.1 long-chain fatty acid--CoA ligase [Sphingomonas sp. CD22]